MSYDPALKAALSGDTVHTFCAVEIVHPVLGTIRLLDGDGFLSIGGNIYLGNQAGVGSMGPVTASDDGEASEAPTLSVTILPETSLIGVDLSSPLAQGAPVTCYAGAFDPVTGGVVGTPYVWFVGEVDVPNLPVDDGGGVTFECVSGFERFLETDEGFTLSHAFHQTIFPGEMGFEYVTDVELQMPWGQDGVRPVLKGS
jgi:hypothetical protein